MFRSNKRFLIIAAALSLFVSRSLLAQNLTLPPSGDNQKASVTQHIGLVRVTVDYSSPDVHGPTGEDRAGKIWGELVPYGAPNLGFGTCKECPWRAGANENTVVTVSHDVTVEGKTLPKGAYGLHMIPGKDEWTVIFSKNASSWGSYYYDPAQDALRVKAKPAKSDYHEWLTYEFTDRKPDQAVLALKWENLQLPMTIKVSNVADVYLAQIKNELQTSFDWQAWNAAANYALQNKRNLVEAQRWAENAVSGTFIGQENFTTLSTLARLQEANGKVEDSKKTFDRALAHPTAGPIQVHQYARQLLTDGKKEEAMRAFELNARRHPNVWPVNVGLARGHAAMGRNQEALKYARLALTQAPDEGSKKNTEGLVKQLEEGKNVNQ